MSRSMFSRKLFDYSINLELLYFFHIHVATYIAKHSIIASPRSKDREKNSDCYLPGGGVSKRARVRRGHFSFHFFVNRTIRAIRANKSSVQIKKCLARLAGG